MRIIHARVASRIALGIVLATLLAAAQANHYILPCGDEPCTPDGSATDIAIGSPGAVTTDSHGNVYFSSPSLVYRLDAHGKLSRIAGSSTSGFAGDGGPATDALLNFPATYAEYEADPYDWYELVGGLAADAPATVYIADAYNHRVRKGRCGGHDHDVAGQGRMAGGRRASGDGRLVVSEMFGTVYWVAVGGHWEVLTSANCGHYLDPACAFRANPRSMAMATCSSATVTAGYAGSVRTDRWPRLPATTRVRAARASRSPAAILEMADPRGLAALANLPYAVAVDRDNNVFIADTENQCIRKVDRSYVITTFAGRCTQWGFDGDGGPATSALLTRPHGVAVDRNGNVYIADTGNNRIRKVDANWSDRDDCRQWRRGAGCPSCR
jgi:hypothetical protein